MAKHKRREGYWKYYEPARAVESEHVRNTLVQLIRMHPPPQKEKKSKRGKPPTHSPEKLAFACLWMMMSDSTYSEAEEYMRDNKKNLPWDEPAPDHTKICRHMQTLDIEWMDMIVAETARLCMAELGDGVTAPLVTDSSAIETTRYEDAVRPNKKKGGFETVRVRKYLKHHIIATEGHQIILAARTTPSDIQDTSMFKPMLEDIQRCGYDIDGRLFNADRGYDSDENCEATFKAGLRPNIKSRDGAVNRGKPSRKKAAAIFDAEEYKMRGMVEGIFGAEETKRHQLQCRFIREDNRQRFSNGMAIAWNIRVLGRFRCANSLNIPIPSYGKQAACA